MSYVASLKQRVQAAETELAYYKSLVDSFFTGDIPEGATLDHFIIAKYGRKRLEDQKATAVLLRQ